MKISVGLGSLLLSLSLSGVAHAVIPPVQGGSGADQTQINDAMAKLPPCIKGTIEANNIQTRVCNGSQNAFFVPTGYTDTTNMVCPALLDGKAHIEIDMDFFRDAVKAGDAMAKDNCINRSDFQDMPVSEILLHESAHAYQAFNSATVDGFLAAGFNRKFQQYRNDPRVQARIAEMRKLSINGKLKGEELCKQTYALFLLYKAHGLALRNPSDMHSSDVELFDDKGNPTATGLSSYGSAAAEYWAMVVEMYAVNGWKFCATLSETEKQWFASNMAECMRQFPTPDCMKNRNAFKGPVRPSDGGTFLKK